MNIHVRGCNFVDDLGRTMIQRGINLSGSNKVPFTPNGATQIDESLFEHDMVSILGRPLPLNQAKNQLKGSACGVSTIIRQLINFLL